MIVAVLIFKSKYCEMVFVCQNDTSIILNMYKVFEERLSAGWYEDDDRDNALEIVEARKNGQKEWVSRLLEFMECRRDCEYEDFDVMKMEMKTVSDDLVDFIPKRYRVLSK